MHWHADVFIPTCHAQARPPLIDERKLTRECTPPTCRQTVSRGRPTPIHMTHIWLS